MSAKVIEFSTKRTIYRLTATGGESWIVERFQNGVLLDFFTNMKIQNLDLFERAFLVNRDDPTMYISTGKVQDIAVSRA